MNGWIVVNKPLGMTSSNVVSKVRHLTGIKKIGHSGTLDSLATGVLPLALNEATKVIQYALNAEKAYGFTIAWGQNTTTHDRGGTITETSQVSPSAPALSQAIQGFLGPQDQRPPIYSAIKIQGKRASDRARQGESPDLKTRPIHIFDFKVLDHDASQSSFYLRCTKGTYVRALARDLCQKLGVCGHVATLTRVQNGCFHINHAIDMETLAKTVEMGLLMDYVFPVTCVLDDIPAVTVSGDQAVFLRNGLALPWPSVDDHHAVALYQEGGVFIGMAQSRQGVLYPRRMMKTTV